MPNDPNEEARSVDVSGEEALIAEFWAPLAAGADGAFGLQDDCATFSVPVGEEVVVTTDALIAGVHFFPHDDAADIGWKALAVNVSDLVAKGAAPLAYVMNVALPRFDRSWLEGFTSGLRSAQEAFGCRLIGGDTDRTPGPLTVSITAFGAVPAGRMVRRGGAKPGDYVYVTGSIGDAALGLALRRDPSLGPRAGLDDDAVRYLAGRFSRPRPPVAIAPGLLAIASAAMDVSDGLVKDFDRLCRASGVAGRLEAGLVPLSVPAQAALAAGCATLEGLLTGGEDYEVLATVAPDAAAGFEMRASSAGVCVTRIGVVTAGSAGATAIGATGEALSFTKTGWDHFFQV